MRGGCGPTRTGFCGGSAAGDGWRVEGCGGAPSVVTDRLIVRGRRIAGVPGPSRWGARGQAVDPQDRGPDVRHVYGVLRQMARGLRDRGVAHVVVEAGVCTGPVYCARLQTASADRSAAGYCRAPSGTPFSYQALSMCTRLQM